MRFQVTSTTTIRCEDCKGETYCEGGNVYNTDHLTCNCVTDEPSLPQADLDAPEDGTRTAGRLELELDPEDVTDTDVGETDLPTREPIEDTEIRLSDMTHAELKAIAKDLGVKNGHKMKMEVLIDAIIGAQDGTV